MGLFKHVPFHKRLKAALEAAEEQGYHVKTVEQDHSNHPIVMNKESKKINITGPNLKRKISKEDILKVAKHINKVHTPILDDLPGEGKFAIHLERKAGSKKRKQEAWIEIKGTLGFKVFSRVYGHEPTIGPWGIGATNSSHQKKIRDAYRKKLKNMKAL